MRRALHTIDAEYNSESERLKKDSFLYVALCDTYIYSPALAAYLTYEPANTTVRVPDELLDLDIEFIRDPNRTLLRCFLGMSTRTLNYDFFTPIRFLYNIIQASILIPFRLLDFGFHKLSDIIKDDLDEVLKDASNSIGVLTKSWSYFKALCIMPVYGITKAIHLVGKVGYFAALSMISPRRSYLTGRGIHPLLGAASVVSTIATQSLVAAPAVFATLGMTAIAGLSTVGPTIAEATQLSLRALTTIVGVITSVCVIVQSLRYIGIIKRRISEESDASSIVSTGDRYRQDNAVIDGLERAMIGNTNTDILRGLGSVAASISTIWEPSLPTHHEGVRESQSTLEETKSVDTSDDCEDLFHDVASMSSRSSSPLL